MSNQVNPTWAEQVIAKAGEDAAFREELLKNPKVAIQKVTGGVFPDGIELKVVEETPDTLYLVLPFVSGDEISEDELDEVVGGRGILNVALRNSKRRRYS